MRLIDFTGTSYLAIDKAPAFLDSIKEGMALYGINFGGSRLSNTALPLYKETEEFFAAGMGFADTLLVSSGTLAAILVARYLKDRKYTIFVYGDLHPALKSNFMRYNTFEDVRDIRAVLDSGTPVAVLTDSINPVTLQKPDWHDWRFIKEYPDLLLVIDDSHGLGVTGEQGWGISEIVDKDKTVIVASLAKALSLRGGIIAAGKDIIGAIREMALWGGASPPPPFYFYAFLKNSDLYRERKKSLKRIIDYMIKKSREYGYFQYDSGFPVFVNKGKPLYRHLLAYNIKISAFSYPKKDDPFTERIVLNASHLYSDIDILFDAIKQSGD